MPTYTFLDIESGEQFEIVMKISERDQFMAENPNFQPVIHAPALVSGVSTKNRVPEGFKEVLSKVAESHPNSNVAEKHGNKTIKQVKTDQVVKSHVKRVTGVEI